MAASKDAVMLVLDIGRGMEGGGLANAKEVVFNLLKEKFVQGGQHQFALVVFGSENTNNELNEVNESDYKGVDYMREFAKPSSLLFSDVQDLEETDVSGDAIDGLVFGVHALDSFVAKKKFNKRIFLITSASTPIDEPEQIKLIGETIRDNNIALNVIGIGFSNEFETATSGDDRERSETETQNEALLRELVGICEKGVVLNDKQALSMFSKFRYKKTVPRPKFKGSLDISSSIKIQVEISGKTVLANIPSLKKKTKEGEAVKMQTSYENKESGDVYDKDENVRAYEYGKTVVPADDIHEPILSYSATKCFSVLGFVPQSQVPRQHFMSTTDVCVAASNQAEENTKAFSALVQAMDERQQVAIVRYIKKDGSGPPVLGCLSPSQEPEINVLYLNQLPFADDVREYDFASTKHIKPTEAQLEATQKYIEALDLTDRLFNEEIGEKEDMLKPENTYNPVLQRYYRVLDSRLLDDSAEIGTVPDDILAYMNPDVELFKEAEPEIKALASQFVLQEVEAASKGQRLHWRELIDQMGEYHHADVSGEDQGQLAGLMKTRIKEVGTQHPLEDYQQLISQPECLAKATKQILGVAFDLVENSYQGSRFEAAFKCVAAARSACVSRAEFKSYNEGLAAFSKFREDSPAFWNMLVKDGLRPIDSSEVPDSDVTQIDSMLFLEAAKTEVVEPTEEDEDFMEGFED